MMSDPHSWPVVNCAFLPNCASANLPPRPIQIESTWCIIRNQPMMLLRAFAFLFAFILTASQPAFDSESQIKGVLNTQIEAWNRGDIPTFVTTYADDCIFIGKKMTQGRAQLLDRYRKTYPTAAAMGHLTFNSLAVHMLDGNVALVTAEWHLERSPEGGGAVGGLFSLVFRRQNGLWKIVLDHTS